MVAEKIKPCGTRNQTMCSFTSEIAKNEIPELAKKSDYCPSMSKTRQCLKTLNGGNLDTVQEFWDSSGILGQDSVEKFFKILNLGGNLFQFTRKYKKNM